MSGGEDSTYSLRMAWARAGWRVVARGLAWTGGGAYALVALAAAIASVWLLVIYASLPDVSTVRTDGAVEDTVFMRAAEARCQAAGQPVVRRWRSLDDISPM